MHKLPIYLATDHAGFTLKETIKDYLLAEGYDVKDLGAYDDTMSDYPDFIIPAAEAVAASNDTALGIVFGGSGIGECIAANKVVGARAAEAYDLYTAKKSREHNDANVLCLGGRTITKSPALAKKIVKAWLTTSFSKEDRYVRRIKKVSYYETH